jgi:hypothetical protein
MTKNTNTLIAQAIAGLFALATAWLGYAYNNVKDANRDQNNLIQEQRGTITQLEAKFSSIYDTGVYLTYAYTYSGAGNAGESRKHLGYASKAAKATNVFPTSFTSEIDDLIKSGDLTKVEPHIDSLIFKARGILSGVDQSQSK